MPHEWPPPPPPVRSRSARRKHITCKALTEADWYKPRQLECFSDGDDDGDDDDDEPPTRRELFEPACQSRGKGFESAGKGTAYYDSSGLVNPRFAKEGKARFPAKNRVDHNFIALQQYSGTLRLSGCPLPGPFKHVVKSIATPSIIPEVRKEKHGFDAREPFSPEVTCLGRVKIREKPGHYSECASLSKETPSPDIPKPLVKVLDGRKQLNEGSFRKKKSGIKKDEDGNGGCLSIPRRHPSRDDTDLRTVHHLSNLRGGSPALLLSDTTETRRERAAALARTLTSLLEDLRRLEMEKSEYVPPVPPPNSLLLMRRFQCAEKLPEHQVTIKESMPVEHALSAQPENYGMASQVICSPVVNLYPLIEIKNASSESSLWQRRALGKLTAIDTKRPMKIKQPRIE